MNANERIQFIRELTANVTSEIIEKNNRLPDDWNGIELRQYIADKFAASVFKGTMSIGRMRAYKNTVIINNL